jgi:hypothetical protein
MPGVSSLENGLLPDREIPAKSLPGFPFIVLCYLLVRCQRWLIIHHGGSKVPFEQLRTPQILPPAANLNL